MIIIITVLIRIVIIITDSSKGIINLDYIENFNGSHRSFYAKRKISLQMIQFLTKIIVFNSGLSLSAAPNN